MKIDGITCDCCGRDVIGIGAMHWESRPSVFALTFPRDGINGGKWNMDVCEKCRHALFDAITLTIRELRGVGGRHSIHCDGYRGQGKPFDETYCDCGGVSLLERMPSTAERPVAE